MTCTNTYQSARRTNGTLDGTSRVLHFGMLNLVLFQKFVHADLGEVGTCWNESFAAFNSSQDIQIIQDFQANLSVYYENLPTSEYLPLHGAERSSASTKKRCQRRCRRKLSSDTCRVHPLGDPPLHNFLGINK